jgi:sortase (surface protein transpeptidase)
MLRTSKSLPKSHLKHTLRSVFIAAFLFGMVFVGIGVYVQWQNAQFQKEISSLAKQAENQSNEQKPSTNTGMVKDPLGEAITAKVKDSGINMGFLYSKNLKDVGQTPPVNDNANSLPSSNSIEERETLEAVVKAPENAQQTSLLVWEKYGIKAPVQYASFQDIFQAKPDGVVDFTSIVNNDPIDSPVQQLLTKGIVHLPFSPFPGELGNSYIIGHSSNYINVKSDYNEVFKPLINKTQNGDEFFIYDHKGRALKFEVFDSLVVKEEEVAKAYESFDGRRVVTLQGSILETINGKILPTKRWLVRAELKV